MEQRATRREFLVAASAAAVAMSAPAAHALNSVVEIPAAQKHEVAALPYGYADLEPFIDGETMHLHHDKHHQSYVNNLNAALEKYPELQGKSAEWLVGNLALVPEAIRTTVKNQGGGHANHSLFWTTMGKTGSAGVGGAPGGAIAAQIQKDFGGFEVLKKAFNDAAAKQFGSGWGWLVWDGAKLKVMTTANQDSPLSDGLKPILLNDVWEHAYYLQYRNRRAEYLAAWWNVVNWTTVDKRFTAAKG